MSDNTSNPLVSIIVRTKDRPKLLLNALKTIHQQTYRPIEVVLVNDGGCDLDLDEIKSILGDVTLNYIRLEKNTGRAHAGNVGIDNAKGEYIGFLD
ncbi:MAG: glycosyltransferase family 2 protein, partial [Thermodesulfovibrionales bacterium]|nr:glycosyltransferase family 2 protein [Thermodesulfovibrionales bacterium]